MSAEEIDRTKVTFSQAEGLEPMPEPLKLEEVSHDLRTKVWKVFQKFMGTGHEIDFFGNETIGGAWANICCDIWVADGNSPTKHLEQWTINKNLIEKRLFESVWNKFFDMIQFVLRHKECPEGFVEEIRQVFTTSQAAYEIIDSGPTIVPRTTPEEGIAIIKALKSVENMKLPGARSHLQNAIQRLNAGEYADSVRESIHAVEAVARTLDPGASRELAPALAAIEKRLHIHGALKKGFLSIYGYTCDAKGIRHSLLDQETHSVDVTDAVFMFGACACFVSYLANKARSTELLSN